MNNFKNLVFEGGGVKGIAYGGALVQLREMGILQKIERVAGASAGAIIATLVAVGYSAQEVSNIIAQTNFKNFADSDRGFIRDIIRLIRHYGWFKGDKFTDWIGELIATRTKNEHTTFQELHENRSVCNALDLYIIGSNLSQQTVEIYSHETTPAMEIRDAVRISMSIPFYFQCVSRNKEVLVDGGVTCNYPIDAFDHTKYLANPENGEHVDYNTSEGFVFNHETLGFRLDAYNVKEQSMKTASNIPKDIEDIFDYSWAVIDFMSQMAHRLHLHKNDWNRTVYIDAKGVNTTEFDLPQKKIDRLIQNGEKGVINHFTWRNGPDGLEFPK